MAKKYRDTGFDETDIESYRKVKVKLYGYQ